MSSLQRTISRAMAVKGLNKWQARRSRMRAEIKRRKRHKEVTP